MVGELILQRSPVSRSATVSAAAVNPSQASLSSISRLHGTVPHLSPCDRPRTGLVCFVFVAFTSAASWMFGRMCVRHHDPRNGIEEGRGQWLLGDGGRTECLNRQQYLHIVRRSKRHSVQRQSPATKRCLTGPRTVRSHLPQQQYQQIPPSDHSGSIAHALSRLA